MWVVKINNHSCLEVNLLWAVSLRGWGWEWEWEFEGVGVQSYDGRKDFNAVLERIVVPVTLS